MVVHKGSCHCSQVEFEVEAPSNLDVSECNCSICYMVGFQHIHVPKSRFRMLKGKDVLAEYQFNTKVARHYFCTYCGVKSFYVPRSHPDGISVNARCLSREKVSSIQVTPFDGKNWETNVHELRMRTLYDESG